MIKTSVSESVDKFLEIADRNPEGHLAFVNSPLFKGLQKIINEIEVQEMYHLKDMNGIELTNFIRGKVNMASELSMMLNSLLLKK